MALSTLYFDHTPVAELAPLKGLLIEELRCGDTKVSDLRPLEGMPLTKLDCRETGVADLAPLKKSPSLKYVNAAASKVTPQTVAELQKTLPDCTIVWDDPAKATKR